MGYNPVKHGWVMQVKDWPSIAGLEKVFIPLSGAVINGIYMNLNNEAETIRHHVCWLLRLTAFKMIYTLF